MNMPLVSVIIPHLNQPDHLRTCLRSLSQQAYDMKQFEIIVVDNGSRELPEAICNEFKNVRLLQEATPGPGPARNTGVGAARGEILAFIDADCVANGDWVEAAVEALGRPGVAVVGGDVRIAYENPEKLTALEAYESVFAYRQKEYIEKKGFTGTGNLATRPGVMEKVGPFRGIDVAEDRDWGQRANLLGVRIVYVAGMIVSHPARKTFKELTDKWDRHMIHDFNVRKAGFHGRLRSASLAALLAMSAIVDARKILLSDRLPSFKSRVQACFMLFRIRMYRAYRTIRLAMAGKGKEGPLLWNRK